MAKLHFYYSAMNAGKSTTLLQSNYNYQERGMDTLVMIPKIVGTNKISCRIGLSTEAVMIEPEMNLYDYAQKIIGDNANIKCILVDEAQFLSKDQVKQLAQITSDLAVPVLAYGLRTDFMGEPFEGSKYLLALADQLIEIKTICHCGRKANMILRIDQNGKVLRTGAQVEIGGNDRYVSVCRAHFYDGKIE